MKKILYRRTQVGWVVIVSMDLAILLIIILVVFHEFSWTPVIVAFILGMATFLFASLTVEIDEEFLTVRFGPGLIRKSIPLRLIVGCQAVRNHWYYGWGIRKVPGGWMYNVSGLDALELRLQDGSIFRFGTDDPQGLMQAIGQVLGRSFTR
jgi:hypothetical protein